MDILAIWGAGLSTVLAVSQAARALYQRRPHVRVEIFTDLEGDQDQYFVVAVTAVNHGSRPVQIAAVGWLDLEKPDRRHWFDYEPIRQRLPKTINHWEMFREAILEEEIAAEKKRSIAGWVKLSTGQFIQSKPTLL